MGRRTALILLLILALLALPLFCLGGTLEHPCETCQDLCGHDTCTNDPCDWLLRTNESDGHGIELPSPDLLAIVPIAVLEQAAPPRPLRLPVVRPAPSGLLPYHASDLPLRI